VTFNRHDKERLLVTLQGQTGNFLVWTISLPF